VSPLAIKSHFTKSTVDIAKNVQAFLEPQNAFITSCNTFEFSPLLASLGSLQV
jgi:hypothetical protein